MLKGIAIAKTLEHFISKKLVAFIAVETVLFAAGAIEEAVKVALAYFTAQGAVDVAKVFRKNKDKAEA